MFGDRTSDEGLRVIPATVIVVESETYPEAEAVMVAVPAMEPVATVNDAEREPAGIVTMPGGLAMLVSEEERETVSEDRRGTFDETVMVSAGAFGARTEPAGLSVKACTVTVADPGLYPVAEAVIVAVPPAEAAVTVKVAVVEPAFTKKEEGTVATVVSEETTLIVSVVRGAGLIVIVMVADPPAAMVCDEGDSVKDEATCAVAGSEVRQTANAITTSSKDLKGFIKGMASASAGTSVRCVPVHELVDLPQ